MSPWGSSRQSTRWFFSGAEATWNISAKKCAGWWKASTPNVPVHSISSMDQIIARSLADRRFALELLGVFAAVALLLAAIGIYGVMSYSFSQRTHEVGIRIALGAQRLDILRMALGEGMRIVVIGLASGLVGAAMMTRFFRSMLFGVAPTDPTTFVFGISYSCWRRAFRMLHSGKARNPRGSSCRSARRMKHSA